MDWKEWTAFRAAFDRYTAASCEGCPLKHGWNRGVCVRLVVGF